MPISRLPKRQPVPPIGSNRRSDDPAVKKLRLALHRSHETPDVRRKAENILENYQTLRDEMDELVDVLERTQNEKKSLELGLKSIAQATSDEQHEARNRKEVLEEELANMRSMAKGLFTGMKDDLELVGTNVRDLYSECGEICDELEKSELDLKRLGKRKNTIPQVALERMNFLSAATQELSKEVADGRVQIAKLNYQRSSMKQRHREATASLSRLRAVTDTSLQDATSQYTRQLRERDQDRATHAHTIRFLIESMNTQMSKYQPASITSQQSRLQAESSVLLNEANQFLSLIENNSSLPDRYGDNRSGMPSIG
eukprot:TRINITY_DN22365_c0_g1_i1.p1 TRINITY_DN22365_c0_g1~~TRINITY_DN22365_c0_g1_i1.p1  ORF type:complete len:314 (+),score=64.89 TRINITY_DN22365_c0_g1_i1:68-1009(+)